MVIRQLAADDWALYRDVRLEALVANPEAFASTFEREQAFTEAEWRRRITVGPDGREMATFAINSADGIDGTAAIVFTPDHHAPMLVAMWVRPTARGTGAGARLVEAAFGWARAQGEQQVVLWVVHDNAAAIGLYESLGFRPTGVVDTLTSNPCSGELEMVCDLGAP